MRVGGQSSPPLPHLPTNSVWSVYDIVADIVHVYDIVAEFARAYMVQKSQIKFLAYWEFNP